jgi:hypothetical protein
MEGGGSRLRLAERSANTRSSIRASGLEADVRDSTVGIGTADRSTAAFCLLLAVCLSSSRFFYVVQFATLSLVYFSLDRRVRLL